MQPSFIRKRDFGICKTNVGTQKIYVNRLSSYNIIIASFQMNRKYRKIRFFEKTFLLADIGIDITFEILFVILIIVKVNFNNQELR